MRRSLLVAAAGSLALAFGCARERVHEQGKAGNLEIVSRIEDQMPTGVTVSRGGRVFVCFPRWGDPVDFTVAELRSDGEPVPYPDRWTNAGEQPDQFISVQSVVVDPKDRLWILDTGSVEFGPVQQDGAKLVGYDLQTDRPFKTIRFPADVVLPTTYLNDVRFDLRSGREKAFITDSSLNGPNGIIVVDLQTGRSWRKLHDDPSTKAEPGFVPMVEGRPFASGPSIGCDGLAITEDRLFFCPLSGRTLWSVSLAALLDEDLPDAQVAATLVSYPRDFASDGLESDDEGRIYLTDYENGAIKRFDPATKQFEHLVNHSRLSWPDTLSLSRDGWLYVTASQLHRQPQFNGGQDLRVRPFHVLRYEVDEGPAALVK